MRVIEYPKSLLNRRFQWSGEWRQSFFTRIGWLFTRWEDCIWTE